jgi:type II secretory pathway component HofQ
MEQPVTLSFKNEEVGVVVAVLKYMADINLITGVDMSKKVTLELQDVPLRQAMETTLRMANLGIIEEEGIYQILDYKDAIKVDREQRIIPLENAKATDVQTILEATIVGTLHGDQIKVTANEAGQLVVISAPRERMSELVNLVRQLDIAQPKSPTVTEAIQLNFADPAIIAPSIQTLLSPGGTATPNADTRHIIIKDLPVVVEQVRHLIAKLDIAVKRVAIDSMLVDVSLNDDADTGVDWVLNAVQKQNRAETNLGLPGNVSGNLQNLGMVSPLGFQPGTLPGLAFGVLGKRVDLRGLIQAEIRNRNGRLISNPQLVTIENQQAKLTIAQEVPFIELKSSDAGGQQTTTEFKEVGTVLTVTPRVTHDNQIIAKLIVKESDTIGEFNGVPIEDARTIDTTVRMLDGETVFMAGLRKADNDSSVRKVPILGDIPVVNFLFRQNTRTEATRELLVFLTCNVISDDQLITPYQEEQFEDASQIEIKVDGQRSLFHDMVHPDEMRDPPWKWRRTD